MSHNSFTSSLVLITCLSFLLNSHTTILAQTDFTVATPIGFAEGTTGGGDATPTTVSTDSEFYEAATSESPAVIVVSGNIDIGAVNVNSDKTIIGADSSSTITGNLMIHDESNVIIQNLNITNPHGAGSADGIEISEEASGIFVHKCTFIDCADGSIDIKRASTDVTVSWCRFMYPTRTEHCFPNLIGSNDGHFEDRGNLKVTMHHNWYDEGCQQRMPRVRFGEVHVFNNYYGFSPSDPETDYAIGVGVESSILVEKSYFDDINITWWNWSEHGEPGQIQWRNLCLKNTTPADWTDNADVFDPPYSYSMHAECDIKDIVTDSASGAGNKQVNLVPTSIIQAMTNQSGIKLYPNPTSDFIQLKGIKENARFMLYDLNGKPILYKEIKSTQDRIMLDNISAGIYIAKIIMGPNTFQKKLIVRE